MNQAAREVSGDELKGIQEVARELGITHRTLRFYEDKGLIAPQRIGTTRVYSKREMGRMRLILRGKRLGFSIREIGEFLDLYDADPRQHVQIEALLKRVRKKREDLRQQRRAIEETMRELDEIAREAEAYLAAMPS
ncbi:MAG: MerR family transcriptional regulator [Croceibacterium sp.]